MKSFISALVPRFVSIEMVAIDFGDGDKMLCEKRHLPPEFEKYVFAKCVKNSLRVVGLDVFSGVELNAMLA